MQGGPLAPKRSYIRKKPVPITFAKTGGPLHSEDFKILADFFGFRDVNEFEDYVAYQERKANADYMQEVLGAICESTSP